MQILSLGQSPIFFCIFIILFLCAKAQRTAHENKRSASFSLGKRDDGDEDSLEKRDAESENSLEKRDARRFLPLKFLINPQHFLFSLKNGLACPII
jgi:hypothetical protein